jgi:hypothetical protein
MNPRFRLALPLVAMLAAASSRAGVRAPDERHPCRPNANVLRFYDLDSRTLALARLDAALAELGAERAYGPRTTGGRPGHAFVAIRVPRTRSSLELESALRKGSDSVDALAATAFDGRTGEDHELVHLHATRRDIVLNMSGAARWYDTGGTWSQIFGRPGLIDPHYFIDRYEKLNRPYGGARFGQLERERFSWTLAKAPDERQASRLPKELERLAGVERAALAGTKLELTVVLRDLLVCGDAGKVPEGGSLDEQGKQAPRVAFDDGGVYELLKREGLLD